MPTSPRFPTVPSDFAVCRVVRAIENAPNTGSSRSVQPRDLSSPCRLPDVIPGNADGLLLRRDADGDVRVHIPYEPHFAVGDDIDLILNEENFLRVEPINPADQPPVITRVVAGPLAEGRHTVTYQVVWADWNSAEGFPAQPLRIDRTAPGGAAIAGLDFSQQVIDHGVTPADLVAGLLSATVPAWAGMEAGDWVEPYYMLDPLTGAGFSIRSADKQVASGEVGQAQVLGIPLAALQAMGDGVRWFGFVLRDEAGNASTIRPPLVPLDIRLVDIPTNLRPPRIDRYDDDGVISDADARASVEVVIPGFDRARAGDDIVFVLGSARSARIPIEQDDVTQDPLMTITIGYTMVASGGGPGAPQRYDAEAYYEVYRGADLLASSPQPNSVGVDITLPGGPDPDPSSPVHESLRLATVRGDSGVDNVISAADTLRDATVFVPFHAEPGGLAYLEVGDVIRIDWGPLELAASRTINQADLDGGLPVALTVTSAEMISLGMGTQAVSYRVSRPIAGVSPPLFNTAVAGPQNVAVSSADLLPGGPGGLPVGDFAEKNPQNALNKALVESGGGTPYRVTLDYLNVAAGDRIGIELQGYDNLLGTGPLTPNTFHSAEYVLTVDDLPTEEDPDRFHDFLIPTHYFAGKWTAGVQGQGSVVGQHSIENLEGQVQAPPVMVRVAVTDL